MGNADARALVLGLCVPELELSPRAPLFPGGAVLSAAGVAAGARPLLRTKRHAVADLRPAAVRLVHREPGPAYGLEPRSGAGWRGPAPTRVSATPASTAVAPIPFRQPIGSRRKIAADPIATSGTRLE